MDQTRNYLLAQGVYNQLIIKVLFTNVSSTTADSKSKLPLFFHVMYSTTPNVLKLVLHSLHVILERALKVFNILPVLLPYHLSANYVLQELS